MASSSSSRKGDYHHDLLKENIFSHVVKDQGLCNACWAIVGAATASSLYNSDQDRKENRCEAKPHVEASPQELVDRLHVKYRPTEPKHIDKAGCMTSNTNKAFTYIKEFGLSMENEFPFVAKRECCENNLLKLSETNPRLWLDGHVKAEDKTQEEIEKVLKYRPIAGALKITPELKYFVGEKIFTGEFVNAERRRKYDEDQKLRQQERRTVKNDEDLYHAVMIIGYGRYKGMEYYVIKNSWGTDWGQKGYALVKKDLFPIKYISWPVGASIGGLKKPVKV